MAESIPLAQWFGPCSPWLRAAGHRNGTLIRQTEDEAAAVVISAEELEDLEDALAVAEARLREASGRSERIPHTEVRRRLGLGG